MLSIYEEEVSTLKVHDGRTVYLDEKDMEKLLKGEQCTEGEVSVGFLKSGEIPIEQKTIAEFGTSYHVYVSSKLKQMGFKDVIVFPVEKESPESSIVGT